MIDRKEMTGWIRHLANALVLMVAAVAIPAAAQVNDVSSASVRSQNKQEIVVLTAEDGKKISAILMYPVTGINPHSPAIMFHHGGFGGHPARQIGAPRFAAERLSAKGYTTLSILSRQSSGHMNSIFEESQKDIKAAVDFLAKRGMDDIILAGHSLGSIRIAGYLAYQKDPRIKAAIHLAPTADMPDTLRISQGEKRYNANVAKARKAIFEGRGRLDVSVDLDRTKGLTPDPFIDFTYTLQMAEAFLSWWGPDAKTRNTDRFPAINLPMLLLSGTNDDYVPAGRMEKLKAVAGNPDKVDYIWYEDGDHFFSGLQDQVASDIAEWLGKHGLNVRPPITTRLVDTKLANDRLYPGILYTPHSGIDPNKPVFLLQHGYTGTIMTSSNNWLAQKLAQAGYAALAPMTRSSGLTGIVSAKMSNMVEDLGAWTDYLDANGHDKIITIGHSLGGIWTALYASQSQDERIKAMVFLAPTRSLPGNAQQNLGLHKYRALSRRAKKLVQRGAGKTIITDKYYQSPPAVEGSRSMYFQQAASWLDYWGPQSKAVLTKRLAEIHRPMLSIAGSKDLYVDQAYMSEVKEVAAGPMDLIWYGGADGANHSFTGHEDIVVNDVIGWVKETFPAN